MRLAMPSKVKVLADNFNPGTVPIFDPKVKGPYNVGSKYEYGGEVFTVNSIPAKDDPTAMVPDFKASGATYHIGDGVFKDGSIHVITSKANTQERVQPENYTHKDTGPRSDSWVSRYTDLGAFNGSSWSQTFGFAPDRIRLTLSRSGSGWTFTSEKEKSSSKWSAPRYNVHCTSTGGMARTFRASSSGTGEFYVEWGRCIKVVTRNDPYKPFSGEIFTGNDGLKYKIGAQRDSSTGGMGTTTDFEVSQGYDSVLWDRLSTAAQVIFALDGTHTESVPIMDGRGPYEWRGRFFVVRGGRLWMRTNQNVAPETKTNTGYGLQAVQSPDELNFMSHTSVTDKNKPFDDKNYTYIEAPGPLSYTITVPNKMFDTLLISGLIADSVDIEFKRASGYVVTSVPNFKPDMRINTAGDFDPVPTTAIFHSDSFMQPGDTVKITLNGNVIRVAQIVLGASIYAGFSNVEFSHEYIDYSPFEKDQWGNILYVDGVRVNTYTGTVDLEITDYDIMNRLFTFIGGNMVIINGSDLSSQEVDDEHSLFSSTRMLGRVREFALSTSLKGKKIGDVANYTFRFEETV